MPPTFSLLVPVKMLALAKSRLEVAHLHEREPLMRAFALDVIAAAASAARVARVHVVTDEPGFELAGAVRLPDEGGGDLNSTLRHAALRVRLDDPTTAVAAICADLPCLLPADLDAALSTALHPRWFVADASGTGTTLLAAGPGVDLDPHFGAGSARRHEGSGAVPLRVDVPTLRLDVDTEADLQRARALGVGRHTAAALAGTSPL